MTVSVTTTLDEAGETTEPIFILGRDAKLQVSLTPTAFVGVIALESESGGAWEFVDRYWIAIGDSAELVGTYGNGARSYVRYRLRIEAYTEGSVASVLSDYDDIVGDFRDNSNQRVFTVHKSGAVEMTGDVTVTGDLVVSGEVTPGGGITPTSVQVFIPASLGKVGATAGWVTGGANTNTVTLPAEQTASTYTVPVIGLQIGETVTAFSVVGRAESTNPNVVTLDAALRKHTTGASAIADASLGAITQVSVAADTAIAASKTLASAEVIAATESLYVLLTGTTGETCGLDIQGITITKTLV